MVAKTPTQAMSLAPSSDDKTAIIAAADALLAAIDEAVSGNTQQWTLAIAGSPTGGTYTITLTDDVNGARTTSALAFNASAAAVQAALRLLSGEGLNTTVVTATGTTPNFTHTIQFKGTKADITVTTNISGLTGGSPARTLTEVEEFERKTLHPMGGDMFKENVVDLMEVLATNMEV
jgi:hypothetical protein